MSILLKKSLLGLPLGRPLATGAGLPDQSEFRAVAQGPLHFLAGFQVDGGGQGQGYGDEQADRAALGTDGLHFDGVIYLHGHRLLYKVAVVKGDLDDELT